MIDKKEKQSSIKPVNKHVVVKFVELEEKKTASGVIIPKGTFEQVKFKGDKVYKVEILRKAEDCQEFIPSEGYALVNQLAGFGIPTVEEGYVKVVPESLLLMTSKEKEFKVENIQPQYQRALVKVTSKTDKTDSGIIIPEEANDNVKWDAMTLGGEVAAVSPDIKFLKKGDKIRWDSYMGTEIYISGEEYRLVLESEIIAKIEN